MRKKAILILIILLLTCIFYSCTAPKEYVITDKYYVYEYHRIPGTEEYKEEYVFYFELRNNDEKLTVEVSARDYLVYQIGDKYKYKK